MFARIEKFDLLNGINMAMKAVSSKPSLPILNCLLMEVTENGVQLTGNNMEMSVQTAVIPDNPSMDKETGKVALDAKLFADIIKSLPDDEIEISADSKHLVTIKCRKSKFNIPGCNPENFPVVSDVEAVGSFAIDCTVFRDMVRKTMFCVAKTSVKPVLTGELIKVSDGRMEVCAVDGFRIALSQCETDYTGENFSIIVPGKTLSEIGKLLPTSVDSKVTLSFDNKKVWFGFEGAKVMSNLLEGEFIHYDSMFSRESKQYVKADRAALLNAIERSTLIGEKRTPVKLDIDETIMKISSKTGTGSLDDEINIENEGGKLDIGFNPGFLMEILKTITADQVEMAFAGQLSACIIQPTDDKNCKYMLMPLKLDSTVANGSGESAA